MAYGLKYQLIVTGQEYSARRPEKRDFSLDEKQRNIVLKLKKIAESNNVGENAEYILPVELKDLIEAVKRSFYSSGMLVVPPDYLDERLVQFKVITGTPATLKQKETYRLYGGIELCYLTKNKSSLTIIKNYNCPNEIFWVSKIRFFFYSLSEDSLWALPISDSLKEELVPTIEKPKKGSNIYTWLDYYHFKKSAGYKITFTMLAEESGYSRNTFKVEHKRYKLERGIS